MFKKTMKVVAACLSMVLLAGTVFECYVPSASAGMKTEVLAGEKTLPGAGEFNVIAEPFDWGKDVTRIMLNTGSKVSSSDLAVSDFSVNGKHYSDQAYKDDYNGTRKVMDVYPVDENGNKADSGDYVLIELEYGAGVRGAHTGSYSYANYYTPFTLTYTVKWKSDTYKQHEVVNLLCDDFTLDRYVDDSIAENNFCDYAFFKPQDTGKKRPLIIFFHGVGEGGAGSLKNHGVQMYAYPEVNFADEPIQNIMGGGAYVLLPQSPEQWPTAGFTSESGYLDIVNSLIDNTIKENPDIDTDRIYVGGLSMGGFMASRVILSRPDKYAAAFLCSQAYAITEEDAAKLKDLPIWISCSEADGTCKMDPYTFASYKQLVNAGVKEAKCVVMEDNSKDPTSRYRFYSSDSNDVEDYVEYFPTQENENKVTGQFVWDNVSYSGHNGGWVPVFSNGEYYEKEDGSKVTIMDWLAFHTLRGIEEPNPQPTKTPDNNQGSGAGTPVVSTPTATPNVQGQTAPVQTQTPTIALDKKSVTICKKGYNKVTLKAQVSNSTQTVTWSSSNTKTAVVDNKGTVTAKSAGSTIITASVGGVTATCKVTVKNINFKVKKTTMVIKKGKSVKIGYVVSPKKKVRFKSSSKNVKVTAKGIVKGTKKGTAKITVSCMGVKQIISVKVK